MLRTIQVAMAAACIAMTATDGQAAFVSYSGIQTQTVFGQNFNFNFAGVAASDGTGGTFIIHARGDYDGAVDEALSWDIDGVVSGGPVGGFVDGVGVGGPFDFFTVFQPLGNLEFQRTYTLTGAQLDAILIDSFFDVFVDLNASVGLFDAPNYVEVQLTYNAAVQDVPEPTTMTILGMGAIGLIGLRTARRRKGAVC